MRANGRILRQGGMACGRAAGEDLAQACSSSAPRSPDPAPVVPWLRPRRRMLTMKAIWRGQVIAESDRTLEVDGYRYFPREAVRMELLRPAPMTPDDRV